MNAFQRGDLLGVRWLPSGNSRTQTLGVKGWTIDDMLLLFDVTNTRHQGAGTARIGGKGDFAGTVNMDFDADDAGWMSPNAVVKGQSGLMFFYLTPTSPVQLPAIIEKLNFVSAVDS